MQILDYDIQKGLLQVIKLVISLTDDIISDECLEREYEQLQREQLEQQ